MSLIEIKPEVVLAPPWFFLADRRDWLHQGAIHRTCQPPSELVLQELVFVVIVQAPVAKTRKAVELVVVAVEEAEVGLGRRVAHRNSNLI